MPEETVNVQENSDDSFVSTDDKKHISNIFNIVLILLLSLFVFSSAMLIVEAQNKKLDAEIMAAEVKDKLLMEQYKNKQLYKQIESQKPKDIKQGLMGIVQNYQPKLDPQLTERIVDTVLEQCNKRDIDPILITALIWKESLFDPFAESNKGAVGLTQVMYSVWKETHELENSGVDSKSKLFWIEPNISAGVEIFSKYYTESNYDVVVALNRYHTGSQGLPKGVKPNQVSYAVDILIQAYEIEAQLERED